MCWATAVLKLFGDVDSQGLKLVVVRWPEATKYSAGPPEHWVAVVRQATEIFRTKIV